MDYFEKLEKIMTYGLDRRGMEGVNLTGELKGAAMALKRQTLFNCHRICD